MKWSKYQKALYFAYPSHPGFISVNAVAGGAKTVSLSEIIRRNTYDGLVVAFNTHIADRLKQEFGSHKDLRVSTAHSFGYSVLWRNNVSGLKFKVCEGKYFTLAKQYLEAYPRVWRGLWASAWDATPNLAKLLDFARLTLTIPSKDEPDKFTNAAACYDLLAPVQLHKAVRRILKEGARLAEDEGQLDFCDMVYLPTRWNLDTPTFAQLFVDEVQDLSPAHLALLNRTLTPHTKGMVLGDENQAIFSFAFAPLTSFRDAHTMLAAKEMPLSICYRCPISHLDLARQFVPQIEPRPDAPEGEILHITPDELLNIIQPDDVVLCRNTAPLISTCIQLIRSQKKAHVKGRDISADIVKTIKSASKSGLAIAFPSELADWVSEQDKRLKEAHASKSVKASLWDRAAGALAAYDGIKPSSISQFIEDVEAIFSDTNGTGITLSTVHRFKGNEADRVFIVAPEKLAGPEDTDKNETNISYVAVTRSRRTLAFVSEG